jgi:hypothetical protein
LSCHARTVQNLSISIQEKTMNKTLTSSDCIDTFLDVTVSGELSLCGKLRLAGDDRGRPAANLRMHITHPAPVSQAPPTPLCPRRNSGDVTCQAPRNDVGHTQRHRRDRKRVVPPSIRSRFGGARHRTSRRRDRRAGSRPLDHHRLNRRHVDVRHIRGRRARGRRTRASNRSRDLHRLADLEAGRSALSPDR